MLYTQEIINQAERIQKDGTVNAEHNSKATRDTKLRNVKEYVYFDSTVRIGEKLFSVELVTERLNEQDENLLSLYNVRVKNNSAAAVANSTTSQTGVDNNIASSDDPVKDILKHEQSPSEQYRRLFRICTNSHDNPLCSMSICANSTQTDTSPLAVPGIIDGCT